MSNLRHTIQEWAENRQWVMDRLGWPEESKTAHHQRYGPMPPPKKGKRKPTSIQEIHADKYGRVVAVEHAYQQMPKLYRDVCLVYFANGNTVRDTGRELDMSKGRVMTALSFITGFMTAMLHSAMLTAKYDDEVDRVA